MFYSYEKILDNSEAIKSFDDHEERFDGIGEYEVEVSTVPDFMNFMPLDLDDDVRYPMPPTPPNPQGPMPQGPMQHGPMQHGPMQPGPKAPGPPPSYIPSKKDADQQVKKNFGGPSPMYVSPGTLRPCLFRYVYIWQTNGRSYWAYLVYIDRRSVAGWRWSGYRWVWFGLDLRFIESFMCY